MAQHSSLVTALQNKQPQLFKQSIRRLALFFEFTHIYSYEEIQYLIPYFKIIQVKQYVAKQLLTGSIYYILDNGIRLSADNSKEKIKKSFLGQTKRRRSSQFKIFNLNSVLLKIGQISGVETIFESEQRGFGIAYTTNPQYSLILQFNYFNLLQNNDALATKLKNYWAQKIKFISKFQTLKELPKNILHINLHKFQLLKIHFNQLVYNSSIRNKQIFFLYRGEVEIRNYHNIQNKSVIVKSENDNQIKNSMPRSFSMHSTLLSVPSLHTESAYCNTNQSLLFHIQKQVLEEILEKQKLIPHLEKSHENSELTNRLLNAPIKPFSHILLNAIENMNSSMISVDNPTSLVSQPISKMQYRRINSKYKSADKEISMPKKQKLREHFSDYLSKKFEEFSEIKMKEIDPNESHPILYQMKALNRQPPSYKNLHEQLKAIRIRKIIEQKQSKLRKSDNIIISMANNSENQIYGAGVEGRKQVVWVDKMQNKIQRNLNNRLKMTLKKKFLI